jgi:hypothetical protein
MENAGGQAGSYLKPDVTALLGDNFPHTQSTAMTSGNLFPVSRRSDHAHVHENKDQPPSGGVVLHVPRGLLFSTLHFVHTLYVMRAVTRVAIDGN